MGMKDHVQKWLLLGNLKEVYANVDEENPNIRNIGLSTFCQTKMIDNFLSTKGIDNSK